MEPTTTRLREATAGGILLGIGMGGFVDGIVLHQILQWHNMISNTLPPTTMEAMRINMMWDGVFHAAVWIASFAGILLLHQAAYRNAPIPTVQTFFGQLLLGWGIFNLVEGLIDHHLLALHYVRQVPDYAIYNWVFLGVGGVAFIVIGGILMKTGRRYAADDMSLRTVRRDAVV